MDKNTFLHNQIIELENESLKNIFKAQTNWHVITGAPCSGKTTIIRLIEEKGYKVVHEVGRMYIEQEVSKGRTLEELRLDGAAFDYAIRDLTLKVESALRHKDLIFLDRAFPDSLAFFQQFGLNPNEILPQCFFHRYASVFILDRFPTQKDDARVEDEAAAEFLDKQLSLNYKALGYDVIRVPVLPPEKRCLFVLDHLSV
jgi:predicted ATPase